MTFGHSSVRGDVPIRLDDFGHVNSDNLISVDVGGSNALCGVFDRSCQVRICHAMLRCDPKEKAHPDTYVGQGGLLASSPKVTAWPGCSFG